MNTLRKTSRQQYHSQAPQKKLGINLTKEVKDLHNENFKTPEKEIGEDTRTETELPSMCLDWWD